MSQFRMKPTTADLTGAIIFTVANFSEFPKAPKKEHLIKGGVQLAGNILGKNVSEMSPDFKKSLSREGVYSYDFVAVAAQLALHSSMYKKEDLVGVAAKSLVSNLTARYLKQYLPNI